MPGIPASFTKPYQEESVEELCRTPKLKKYQTENKVLPTLPQPNKSPFLKTKKIFSILGGLLILLISILAFQKLNTAPPGFSNIETPDPDFIERKDYLNRLSQLIPGRFEKFYQYPARKQVLWGLGGYGKSQLAIQFANRYRDRFSFTWKFSCDNENNLNQGYQLLAENLGILNRQDSAETIQKKVHEYLEKHDFKKPWFLIYDDLRETIDFPHKGGVILATSHRALFHPEERVEINPFSEEEAIKLVEKITKEPRTPAMHLLVKDSEYVPLLLKLVAHHIRSTPGCNVVLYQKMLKDLIAEKDGPLWWDQEGNKDYKKLAVSWEFAFKSLEKDHPLALKWLFLCSYFFPDHIPEAWLDVWLMHQNPSSKKHVENERGNLLKALRSRGLINYHSESRTFSIQRLLQNVIRQSRQNFLEEDLKEAILLLTHDEVGCRSFEHLFWKGAHPWYTHASQVQDWVLKYPIHTSNLTDRKNQFILSEVLGNYCTEYGNFQKSAMFFEHCLNFQNEASEAELGRVYRSRAWTQMILMNWEASKQNYEKAEKLHAQVLNGESLDYAETLMQIAVFLGRLEQKDLAFEYDQKALLIKLHDLGWFEKNVDENLGAIASHVIRKSRQINLEEFPKLQEKIDSLALALMKVGKHHLDQNHNETAMKYFEKSLDIYKENGRESRWISFVLMKQAWYYSKTGKRDQALRLHTESLMLTQKLFGPIYRDWAYLWSDIGHSFLYAQNYVEACKAFKKSLKQGLASEGKLGLSVIEAYNNLGKCSLRQNKIKKGLRYLTKPLKFCMEDPKNTNRVEAFLQTFSKIASENIPLTKENIPYLQAAYKKAYEVAQSTLGEDHLLARRMKSASEHASHFP